MLRLTDNNNGQDFDLNSDINIEDVESIANCTIKDLVQNTNVLIFPHSLQKLHGDIQNRFIFSLIKDNNKINLRTNNIMGFVGKNNTQITIMSRFAKEDTHDYFLHYMLQKTLGINLFNFNQVKGSENIWNFFYYLFPYYLKKAYSQGIFKTYQKVQYNNANVKGIIDLKRHIKMNVPFQGKIAYNTSEHSYNNPLTQFIRHTIEHINSHPWASFLLNNDPELRDIVQKFVFVTEQTYNPNERRKIIIQNLKPVQHAYFTEYTPLQKLCLQILRNDRLTFGKEKDKIHGILFDGAWLWEHYLKTILPDSFMHCDNSTGKNVQYLFETQIQPIYPDFLDKNSKIVVDAKYISLDRQEEYSENSERAISIYYKTITYMYRFNSNKGFLLFPYSESSNIFEKELRIMETGGTIVKFGLPIPKEAKNFKDFIKIMKENEKTFIEMLNKK